MLRLIESKEKLTISIGKEKPRLARLRLRCATRLHQTCRRTVCSAEDGVSKCLGVYLSDSACNCSRLTWLAVDQSTNRVNVYVQAVMSHATLVLNWGAVAVQTGANCSFKVWAQFDWPLRTVLQSSGECNSRQIVATDSPTSEWLACAWPMTDGSSTCLFLLLCSVSADDHPVDHLCMASQVYSGGSHFGCFSKLSNVEYGKSGSGEFLVAQQPNCRSTFSDWGSIYGAVCAWVGRWKEKWCVCVSLQWTFQWTCNCSVLSARSLVWLVTSNPHWPTSVRVETSFFWAIIVIFKSCFEQNRLTQLLLLKRLLWEGAVKRWKKWRQIVE